MRLDDVKPEFSAALTNKRAATQNRETTQLLQNAGYRIPAHWKHSFDRPFVGWDGEGITYFGDVEQSYVLFGASTGDRISKPELGTVACFDLLLAVERANPDAIHCGYAIQYDCNMILRDLSRRHLHYLYRHGNCRWNGYRIEYRPGKWISIRYGNTRVRLFDVFGFFQSSFVVACEKFLGADDPELVRIREGKLARKSFKYDQLDTFIVPYWEAELRLLVRLMDSLRSDLNDAGLPIRSWHGPGAVANTVFRVNHVRKAMSESPMEVNRAAQYAYAGGRFELFRCGYYDGSVFGYDINSAYPSAIATLPNLQQGTWRMANTFEPGSFGLWNIAYRDNRNRARNEFLAPQPLFVRSEHGNVSFPSMAEGWYWTPEATLVPTDCIKGGWVFDHDGSKPFEFVRDMYETRLKWKSEGNSAERALKLALNSLYGKMAQRSGWKQEGDPIPAWHQLEWAGFVTSIARSMIWAALVSSLAATSQVVLAVETDAIFTTAPLESLAVGESLGQWSEEQFDWICYVQSGMYYAGQNGKIVERYRGFDKGSLPFKSVLSYMKQSKPTEPLQGATTRFIGMGLGLFTRLPWRSWQTDQRLVQIGGGGKRAHVKGLCSACKAGMTFADGLHDLAVITPGGKSFPHKLPWLEGRENELAELDRLTAW